MLPDLKRDADGGITLYVQHGSPGAGAESNWLPAPAGPFLMVMRLYLAEARGARRRWTQPPLDASLERRGRARSRRRHVPVTVENFPRAESDLYFGGVVKNGGFGAFHHYREPTPLDQQTVIRMNRDTLYSAAVFDLDAGPVTVTLPDGGKRFMSMQVIDEDQYTHGVHYAPGRYALTKADIGTRYVVVAVRTLVDPADPKDLARARALQDAIVVEQPGGPGAFAVPTGTRRARRRCATR